MVALALPLVLGWMACRKAPGPAECVQLAEAVFPDAPAGDSAARPDPRGFPPAASGGGSVDGRLASQNRVAFVRDCLTMPFDRTLVQCALGEDARGRRRCWDEYERRYVQEHGTR